MSIFDLMISPTALSVEVQGNTAIFPSPLIASAQTLDRGGQKWKNVLTFSNMHDDDRATIMALILRLRGQAHRLRIPVHDNPIRGAYGGTPLVDGASQTGSTLAVRGCSLSITNWIRAGDYFSVNVNGEHELKMCTVDASSDGAGDIAVLNFEPRLRASPSDGAAIFVQDGVLSTPTGVFVPESSVSGWTSRPWSGGKKLSDFQLSLIEDVFATQ